MSAYRELRVKMPAYMVEALERMARRQLSNVSVYTRQVLLARLVDAGEIPTAPGEPASPQAAHDDRARA